MISHLIFLFWTTSRAVVVLWHRLIQYDRIMLNSVHVVMHNISVAGYSHIFGGLKVTNVLVYVNNIYVSSSLVFCKFILTADTNHKHETEIKSLYNCEQSPGNGNSQLPKRRQVYLKWAMANMLIIIISCHRSSFFPGTSPLEPVANPTTQASSLSFWHFPYGVWCS
jgi:hypothetical protein